LTLVEPGVYGSELFTAQLIAKAALRSAAAPARRADLAVIASRWLKHDRRTNQGSVFVGEVRRLGMQGLWTENEIEIGTGEHHTVVHVLTEGVKFSTGDAAGVIGAIIDRPSERIAGYEGDAAQVVVAGYTFDPATVDDAPSPAPEFVLPGE
jgi:hypothetical protein